MIFIENIYLCLAAPMLFACLFCDRTTRTALLFVLCGMSACLLSAYMNVFFTQVYDTTLAIATIEIAPFVEEVVKLLPILFYLLVFEAKGKHILRAMLMVAIGFASFENICYLVEHGSEALAYLLVRGFGTGAMHLVCGGVVGYGLVFTWRDKWLKVVGSLGVLCIAIVYHAQYNLLMSGGELARAVGLLMPVGTIFAVRLLRKKV